MPSFSPSAMLGGLILLASLSACDENSSSPTSVDLASASVADQKAAFKAGDFSSCAVCHGSGLQGNPATGAPNLTRLPEWYIRAQLLSFKEGWRGSAELDAYGAGMHRSASLLTSRGIEEAVRHVANYHKAPSPIKIEDKASLKGARLYEEKCASCHGTDGLGIEDLGSPPLAGVSAWYLKAQVEKFQKGWRGEAEDDVFGQSMRAIATDLTPEEITSIEAFFKN